MTIIKKAAVSILALSLATFASAKTISGSTDFRVTLPEVLVLYHWDDAHLILTDVATTPDNDSDGREISDTKNHIQTTGLNGGTYTITENPINPGSDASPFNKTIDVTLKDSWAVRSLSSGNVTLDVKTQSDGKLKLDGTSTTDVITVTEPTLATGGTTDASITIPSGWEAVSGDIKFKLDLSGANKPGEYKTVASPTENTDTFLLTLKGTP